MPGSDSPFAGLRQIGHSFWLDNLSRGMLRSGELRRLVEAGDSSIDLLDRRVLRGGEIVHLNPKEYGVLAELARHPGRVITHRQLLQTIWGPAQVDHVEYLRIAVRGLRQKIEADPAQPRLVINEPGVGYRLQTATDPATKA